MQYGLKIMGGIRKLKDRAIIGVTKKTIEMLNSTPIKYSDHVKYSDPTIRYKNTLQGQKPSILDKKT